MYMLHKIPGTKTPESSEGKDSRNEWIKFVMHVPMGLTMQLQMATLSSISIRISPLQETKACMYTKQWQFPSYILLPHYIVTGRKKMEPYRMWWLRVSQSIQELYTVQLRRIVTTISYFLFSHCREQHWMSFRWREWCVGACRHWRDCSWCGAGTPEGWGSSIGRPFWPSGAPRGASSCSSATAASPMGCICNTKLHRSAMETIKAPTGIASTIITCSSTGKARKPFKLIWCGVLV